MARVSKKKRVCSYAGKTLPKTRSRQAGIALAECRWSKPGARKKQSAVAKKLMAKMRRAKRRK